ncbi:MAG TPA: DHHA1 domain-containing protein [Spirochaetota bacterium]|nr:DHHA1 domain-containing protein [Spirochaetota bacterium]
MELGFDAKAVIGEIATLVDGSGGGRKDMAQAGGKDAAGLDAALQEGRRILEERLQ